MVKRQRTLIEKAVKVLEEVKALAMLEKKMKKEA